MSVNIVWPRTWVDVNPIGNRYSLGYHTGADLNMRDNKDAHSPIYAAADGVVTTAGRLSGSWGNVIVINHGLLPDGHTVYARYAHVENMLVKVEDTVTRGQKIAQVGQFAPGNWHLHFDISTTTVLRDHPSDWPGFDLQRVLASYTDPLAFIKAHRPPAA